MAVGLKPPEKLLAVTGVSLAACSARIKYPDRNDLLLLSLVEGSKVAGVFTKNKFCAAPVLIARKHLEFGNVRALIINSGNANAGTGTLGYENALLSCSATAEILEIDQDQVLPFSTGVIGEHLPMDRLLTGITELKEAESECDWITAAETIMTTDTIAKGASEVLEIDGVLITITGIAKGSGMICPNMATMLSYVATDANISKHVLQEMLSVGTEASFNRITVDSDTSTNDALILVATGASASPEISDLQSAAAVKFNAALHRILIKLATSVIRDAEGATKFVTVKVVGGESESDCEAVAYSVAHSPLVKTALFASDPNWGRILMAVGKAPIERLNVNLIDVQINAVKLIEQGQPADGYTEEQGKAAFIEPEIEITICLNAGSSSYHVWTSDLSSEYVSINADYRS